MLSRKIRAYKQEHPKAKAKEIATAVGAKVPYVYQVLNYKSSKVKKSEPTDGQQVLRKEITRLNNEIDKWKNLSKFHEDKINYLTQQVKDLKAHHSGLEYVISYLEARLGEKDGATV